MSLVGMDLGPKMDWTLDNGLYSRFMPHLKKVRYIICNTGQGKKVPYLFPNGLQKEKSQMMMKKKLLKRKSELIGNSLKTILSQDQIVLLQLLN